MKKIVSEFFVKLGKADVFGKKAFGVLYSLMFVCMGIVLMSQIGLGDFRVRHFFTKVDELEGGYFQATVNVSEPLCGTVSFNVSGKKSDSAYVYVNGEEAGRLNEGENTLEISETSVVEIYSPDGRVEVHLGGVSENLKTYMKNEYVVADGEIKLLCRVGKK